MWYVGQIYTPRVARDRPALSAECSQGADREWVESA